ncbi:MAG: sporulation integral membrane protein YtvI [Eubacteriales bacterium]|nr:sporulation integral membrane protein YtvI [Eubacteriales bacterium]MDD3882715.1 sporulation integral membrane protein YtvI [Eubacteriales bacterium]MDD4512664.1 sporulation integral membrane protein YtvI [Eubacteriales bacterium]
MEGFLAAVRRVNVKCNDLLRKAGLVALVMIAALVIIRLLPLCLPFVFALVFSAIISPAVKLMRRGLEKIHIKGNTLPTIIAMLVIFGLLFWGLSFLLFQLVRELGMLAQNFTSNIGVYSEWISVKAQELATKLGTMVPANWISLVNNAISEFGKTIVSIASSTAKLVAGGAWTTAMSVPSILLFLVLMLMATFYMTSDREKIFAFFNGILPTRFVQKSKVLKTGVFHALFGQMKAQACVSVLVTFVVTIGLLLEGIPYWLLLGLVLGILDILPIVGMGLVLIPWSVIGFVSGDIQTGIGMLLLYFADVMTRQIAEPRLVGAQLGLHPLATMMSMYAGYIGFGSFIGMLLGPILLNIMKVVVELSPVPDDVRLDREARGIIEKPKVVSKEPAYKRFMKRRRKRKE